MNNQESYFAIFSPACFSLETSIHYLRQKLYDQLRANGLDASAISLLRFFCSDVYNQAPVIEKLWPVETPCQRIYIGQQPLDSAYVSLQAYCLDGTARKESGNNRLTIRHGGYESLWTLDYPTAVADSEAQTDEIINAASATLQKHEMTLEKNVVRTWYYLRDVDNNYAGMVKSRVRHYEAQGLLPQSHFIASTGIEGLSPEPHALVALQCHAIKGLDPGQIVYLKALENLSPTHDYGVNFERATKITYGDRAHIHISGTASIDRHGNVLHKGDVLRQTERALENIAALLAEGGMTMANMAAATVYLRDPQDYDRVKDIFPRHFPENCAVNITCGSVCRPDWLVEIEGEAISWQKSDYANFI